MAYGITNISLNIIEASIGSILCKGCKVTSQDKIGCSHKSKNVPIFLVSLNSGKYLPAYLIIQTGKWSIYFSLSKTSKIVLFFIFGKSYSLTDCL